ncbi:MAG: hypothetical protein IJN64_08320 [Lachnospiraceae bacterium]|nr:hypothetical protein [Lachnospiraceae bacterium]
MAEISNVIMTQNHSPFRDEINLEKETVKGNLFLGTQNSKEVLRKQVATKLIMDLKRAEERSDKEGWVEAEDID